MNIAVARVRTATLTVPVGACEAVPHASGALYIAEARTLLISDLHLEKGSCLARRGVFLPPYDTRATLEAVAAAISAFAPRTVVAMGDSFHDRSGADRLGADDLATIARLQQGCDWLWLAGNHDPEGARTLPGDHAEIATIAGITLRHEPDAKATGPEIAGHLHPAAKVRLRGRGVRRRCFVGDGQRLVLPAMGAYAGGLNVQDMAFRPLFARGADVWMLGDDRVFQIGRGQLSPD